LVGTAVVRSLQANGYDHILTATVSECDLRNQSMVASLFARLRPDYMIIAAAKVGGIGANMRAPAEFAYDNLMIATNLIHAAHIYGVKKTLVLGSSCIYPRDAVQPISEHSLLTGALEETNKPYAVAKIAAVVLAQAYAQQYGDRFICAMPTNLYGPDDTFDIHNSHVIPALITRIARAHDRGDQSISIGGSGSALREFLYVDDCAQALIHLMNQYESACVINIGSGYEVSIAELVQLIVDRIGYRGTIAWDTTFPDGTPRKKLDTRQMQALGWSARTNLVQGLEKTIGWYYEKFGKDTSAPVNASGRSSWGSLCI
jgi:GDP-L-fucose synthase